MKNWKRLLALLLSGAMALSLFACGSGNGEASAYPDDASASPSGEASADPDASSSPEIEVDLTQAPLEFSAGVSPTDAMITINGQDVPADIFLYMLAMNCLNMQSYLPYFGMTLSDVADTLLEESISMMAYHVLIRQKAAELGCLLTDAQMEEIRTALDEADLETNIIPYWGMTYESAEFFFAMNAYYSNVLDAATHDPSAEELEEYMISKGLYRVKHILIKTVDDSQSPLPEDEVAERTALAEDLLAQLKAAQDLPAKFDELMNEYSEDGRDGNGDLYAPDGYLAYPGQMDSSFEAASLALEEGAISELVQSVYGYHIILRLPLTPFSDDEQAEYRDQYRPEVLDDIVDQWQAEATITRSDALNSLDIASFYDRLAAYQQAVDEQQAAAVDGVG